MQLRHDRRPFADGGSDALHRAATDVADGEDALDPGLQRKWRSLGRMPSAPVRPSSAVTKLGDNMFQIGKLSFFNNAAYRGSWCKLFSSGSTFVSIRPALRWP